jgi:DNA-binding NarL/FixJ family response regulator
MAMRWALDGLSEIIQKSKLLLPIKLLTPSSFTVLLVEDDPIFQVVIRRAFAQAEGSWQIQTAINGTSALNALAEQNHSFHLALIDIGLPDRSGIEVIAAARKLFKELPIMAITASDDEGTFLSAIRAGASGYWVKGAKDDLLFQSISQIMSWQYPVSAPLVRHLFRVAGSPIALAHKTRLKLSPRELELLRLLAQGYSYTACASLMNIALSTVQTHIRNMYRKLDVSNQRQAIAIGQKSGWLHF